MDEDTGFFSSGGPRARQNPPIHYNLNVTLEDIYTSATKKMKITRKVFNETTRQLENHSKILEIALKPHWKTGTKITFAKEGDQEPGVVPADVVFVLEEKPHPRFTRDGSNLIHKRTINLSEALLGTRIQVVLLLFLLSLSLLIYLSCFLPQFWLLQLLTISDYDS
eukprot:TRINITY_DN20688_c0_g1_i1.p1 TRINITY_DN20688_c0_g1~~TRINITY_DN20688_c0_g1_i1.p1  ORF type:complete len:183 (+),score=20.97 TRINITY_DN20688_c0_g1_i1:52-549(+)